MIVSFPRLNEQVRVLDGKIENLASGNIYVIGQGVRATHAEFGARVLQGFSVGGGDSQSDCGTGVSTGRWKLNLQWLLETYPESKQLISLISSKHPIRSCVDSDR